MHNLIESLNLRKALSKREMFGDQKAIKPCLVTYHVDVALSGQTVSEVFQQTKSCTIFGEMLVSFAVVFGDVTQRSPQGNFGRSIA